MALWEADDYGTMADRACWAMFAVSTVVVILRLICRIHYGVGHQTWGGLGLDDAITTGCMAVMLATCVLVTIGSHYGLGRHMATLSDNDLTMALKYNVIISAVLIWTFSLPKFAIIAILKRILDYGTKTTILFWGMALSSQACILATSVWWFKQCDPVEAGWDLSIRKADSCASTSVLADLGYFTSAYSAFLDLFFALYPIPFIMRLNMPLRNRIAVSVAMSLSSLAFIVSIYKLAIFGSVFEILATDPTYPVPYLDILGMAEGNILIICASLPTLGPIFRAFKRKFRDTVNSQGSNSHPLGSGPTTQGTHSRTQSTSSKSNWSGFRPQKKISEEDLEDGSTTGIMRPSSDIPLVEQPGQPHSMGAVAGNHGDGGGNNNSNTNTARVGRGVSGVPQVGRAMSSTLRQGLEMDGYYQSYQQGQFQQQGVQGGSGGMTTTMLGKNDIHKTVEVSVSSESISTGQRTPKSL
ncbi:hypothetical protein MKZ38_002195 [Zalerion maritima]|uniref:Rhodopsin domain-containing protein n=1 Tax=Zalerion maritima TaxID=339359 RepID=A0AAD5RW16_9PEZI|nr:hypothetical protein MKZ38_002195 [Zalerion maritima]